MSKPASSDSSKTTAKRTERLLNIFVPLLLTLVGSFAVLEFGLRHFYQLIPLEVCVSDAIIGNYYCQPYFVYDEPIRIAYKYEPGLRLEGMWDPANPYLGDAGPETRPSDRSDAFLYVLETDEMGFPNSTYEWRDQYDIIVTGDSFTVRQAPQTWQEILAAQTGQSVLTLGAPSWTTLNEVEAIKQYALDKDPDWVVLLYFEGNDLLNVRQYQEKAATGLSWKGYDMQDVPWYRRLVLYHIGQWLMADDTAETTPNASEPRYRYPVTATTDVGEIETVFKDIHLLSISGDYDTIRRSDEFTAVQNALQEAHQLLEAQGSEFLLVYIPSKAQVYWPRLWDETDVNNVLERTVTMRLHNGDSGRLEWDYQYLSYDAFTQNQKAQAQLLGEVAEEAGFHFLNLTPPLTEATIRGGEQYHYGDPHWNQAGNQLVADQIQQYIENHTAP